VESPRLFCFARPGGRPLLTQKTLLIFLRFGRFVLFGRRRSGLLIFLSDPEPMTPAAWDIYSSRFLRLNDSQLFFFPVFSFFLRLLDWNNSNTQLETPTTPLLQDLPLAFSVPLERDSLRKLFYNNPRLRHGPTARASITPTAPFDFTSQFSAVKLREGPLPGLRVFST